MPAAPVVCLLTGPASDRSHLEPSAELLEHLGLRPLWHETTSRQLPSPAPLCYLSTGSTPARRWLDRHAPRAPHLVAPPAARSTDRSLALLLEHALQDLGHPVPTLALGKAGALNAALFAAALAAALAAPRHRTVRARLLAWRRKQTKAVLARPVPGSPE